MPDGTWSGNVFDFFRKVINKLTAELKVPFVLRGETRIDDTPQHQALREALVNTLVHADYSDRASVRVIKRPSGFEFRNPGVLRMSVAQALRGGESDCRNRLMQQMFLMINLGERAGSGLPRIRAGWEGNGRTFALSESFEPFDQSVLKMDWGDGLTGVLTETPVKTPVKTSDRILDEMNKKPEITVSELAELLEKSESAIHRAIRKMRDAGQIRRVGGDKGGQWEVQP